MMTMIFTHQYRTTRAAALFPAVSASHITDRLIDSTQASLSKTVSRR